MPVPIEIQMALFSRVLLFERNLMAQKDDTLMIGILYQGSDSQSVAVQKDARTVMDGLAEFKKAPFRYSLINIETGVDLASIIMRDRIKLLYVAPGRNIDFNVLSAVSRRYKVITVTGVPAYVDSGVGLGVESVANRPRLVFNLPSLKAASADFSAQILRLSRVIE